MIGQTRVTNHALISKSSSISLSCLLFPLSLALFLSICCALSDSLSQYVILSSPLSNSSYPPMLSRPSLQGSASGLEPWPRLASPGLQHVDNGNGWDTPPIVSVGMNVCTTKYKKRHPALLCSIDRISRRPPAKSRHGSSLTSRLLHHHNNAPCC